MTRRMKDSGIEWIGEIPEDWEVRKLGNISNLYTGNSIKDSEKDNYNSSKNSIPYIATKDVGFDNRIDYENGMYVKKEDIKFKRAYKDNTLICIEGGSAGRKIAKVEYEEVCFGNKLCCINSNIILNKYLYYYSLSPNFSNGFQSRITGLIPGVTLLEMRQIEVIIPPKTQQKSIADFLDKKTGEIDKIISKTKEAIEEYKKYKQSLITETVTKGLDKNAPMKDSGIEWIGEIPEHWEVVRLKYLVRLGMGQSPNSESYNKKGLGIEFLQGNKDFGHIYPKATEYTTSAKKVSSKNDILFSVRAPVGARNISDKEYAIGRGLCSLTAIGLNQQYLWFWMDLLNVSLKTHLRGSTYDSVTIDDINNSFLLKLPLKEQEKIAGYLDEKTGQIDRIISSKEKLLEEMEAYKKSLIYETITGKREVK